MSSGLIHQEGNLDNNLDADFVILAVQVDTALVLLPKILDNISENTIIFDVGSTKKPICDVVENQPKRGNFLVTHSIAGTEFSRPKTAVEN